jgi:3-hydroxybutyryl-CoA dehydrogenase
MSKDNKNIHNIKKVCFVGAGTMGCYNSLVAALAGFSTVVYDIKSEILAQVQAKQAEYGAILIASGYVSQAQVDAAIGSVVCTDDLQKALLGADLVSESIFEQIDIKREIHQLLDQACDESTILSTNSSSLMVSDIESVVKRQDKFAALHTHLLSPLVDIVGGKNTSKATLESLINYVERIGGIALVLQKENPGYVLNAMISALFANAMLIAVDSSEFKQADFKAIDSAWMKAHKAQMGPFGMMDLFGIDIVNYGLQRDESMAEGRTYKSQVKDFIASFVSKGALGVKTGVGFYQYPEPAFKSESFLAPNELDEQIIHRLNCSVINAGLLIAAKNIVPAMDVDKAWMVGMFLASGPFALLEKMGVESFKDEPNNFVKLGTITAEEAKLVNSFLKQLGQIK